VRDGGEEFIIKREGLWRIVEWTSGTGEKMDHMRFCEWEERDESGV